MSLTSICSTSLPSLICPFLKFLLFSLLYIRCHCLSIISNKNQTLIPTIATSLPYSGTKTRHIVIYVTKIKHWIEISRFSKLKFRGSKIRGWQKILTFAEIKFCDLTKKLQNRKIFLPRKYLTIK